MRAKLRIDWWLLAPVAILVIISLTTLLSVNVAFFKSQLVSLAVAIIAFIIFSQLNVELLKEIRWPIYIVSLILLGIILLLGIESRGAVRWLDILGVRLQFSEILKPFLAVALASFLSENRNPTKRTFFLTLLLIIPILALIFLQPDLGNALIYAGVALFALIICGFPFRWFVLAALPLILSSPILWGMLHEYQRQRIITYLHPKSDPLGASYNGIQAIIAVGSGAFFGKGFSQGTQSGLHFLPEGHTDFIFATIAEGLGFVGAVLLIVTLLFLCYRIYLIFVNSQEMYIKIFALCAFGFILIQGAINIAMNMGYLPIVGVTLPFVSFGGSSLLSNFIFLGILSAMSTSQRYKNVLEIR